MSFINNFRLSDLDDVFPEGLIRQGSITWSGKNRIYAYYSYQRESFLIQATVLAQEIEFNIYHCGKETTENAFLNACHLRKIIAGGGSDIKSVAECIEAAISNYLIDLEEGERFFKELLTDKNRVAEANNEIESFKVELATDLDDVISKLEESEQINLRKSLKRILDSLKCGD